ncbi:hypothetical protein M3Y94_00341600 [Aphelenchoides besseyi]|nr:hypothetical protein M3Y94_00341600 [Aphelenchoides besseyi]
MVEMRIDFDSQRGVYFPGQMVTGTVHIRSKEEIKARSVTVSIVGKAKTQWTVWEEEHHHQANTNRGTHRHSIPYTSEIVYIDQTMSVWQPPPNTKRLPMGENRFAFSFLIPPVAPPTFEGTIGFIRYVCKAKIDRPYHIDNKVTRAFTVSPHFDLNTIPYVACPTSHRIGRELGVLFFKHGRVDANVHLPRVGFTPGESISLRMDISNSSKRDIVQIECALIQTANCSAKRHSSVIYHSIYRHKDIETREESRIVFEHLEDFKVAKLSSATYQRSFTIPPVVPSFNICPIIQVGYYLKVKIVAKNYVKNKVGCEIPILLGTIPISNTSTTQTNEQPSGLLVPPMPSAPPDYETSVQGIRYEDSIFKSNMSEDPDEKVPDYIPQYITVRPS